MIIGLHPAFASFCFHERLVCTLFPLCRSGSISRGFRGEFKHWQITPGSCEMSPVMANQFSVTLEPCHSSAVSLDFCN